MTTEVKPNPVIQAELFAVDEVLPSGNVYPRDVVLKAISEIKPHLAMNRVLGQFNPTGDDMSVKLTDAATLVKNLYFRDDVLMADLEILDTPRGEALKEYLRAGKQIQVVPRGMGEVDREEEDSVVRQYTIVTVDVLEVKEDEDE